MIIEPMHGTLELVYVYTEVHLQSILICID
jgi:hypothetical protein